MQDHHRDGSNPSHPAGDSRKHPLRVDFDRRVVAKVEWHPGELYPPVGFIVTNLSRPAARVTKFYNGGREKNLLTILFIICFVVGCGPTGLDIVC